MRLQMISKIYTYFIVIIKIQIPYPVLPAGLSKKKTSEKKTHSFQEKNTISAKKKSTF